MYAIRSYYGNATGRHGRNGRDRNSRDRRRAAAALHGARKTAPYSRLHPVRIRQFQPTCRLSPGVITSYSIHYTKLYELCVVAI